MANRVRPSLSEQTDYAVNIFACLDRFSLDSVGFTCPILKGIVDKHLPEEPLRVLESVTIEWTEGLLAAKLVPGSPLGKTTTIYYGKKMLRRTAALCANSFVRFFKIGEGGDWRAILHTFEEQLPGIRIGKLMAVDYKFELVQHIVQLTRGVESLLMTAHKADVGVESMLWLKDHGIRRLAVYGAYRLTEDAVRAFCIGGLETADEAAPNRSMYLCGTDLSFEFLQQLAKDCLASDASRMPTVTFDRYEAFVPPLPEHLAHSRHVKDRHPCLHFRFGAATGSYEIVVQSRCDWEWRVSLRGGHSAVKECRRETWFRELEEINVL
ncbi:hypothetical protein AAVH_24833 [Aphelenchoides avenae]|nr:hypothetical protein AAVH_24833 [Aphelenchus avenae]